MGSQVEIGGSQRDLEVATTKENSLHTIDAGHPYRPSLLGKIAFMGWVEGVHVDGAYAYMSNTGPGGASDRPSGPEKAHSHRYMEPTLRIVQKGAHLPWN
jgi:hypothetical protein